MRAILAFLLFMFVLVLLALGIANAASFLACDLPEAGVVITQTKIEVTTNPGPTQVVVVVNGIALIDGVNFKVLDLGPRPSGKYSFKVMWADASGWWSDYSLPFAAAKPGGPGGTRIIP